MLHGVLCVLCAVSCNLWGVLPISLIIVLCRMGASVILSVNSKICYYVVNFTVSILHFFKYVI